MTPSNSAYSSDKVKQPQHSSQYLQKIVCVLTLLIFDFLGLSGGTLLALFASRRLPTLSTSSQPILGQYLNFWWFPLLGLAFFSFLGLYTQRRAFWEEIRAIWKATALAHLAALPTLFFITSPILPSVVFIGLSFLILISLLPVLRMMVKKALPFFGLWQKSVLIINGGNAGIHAAEAFELDLILGYKVAGLIELNNLKVMQGEYTLPKSLSKIHQILRQESNLRCSHKYN